jgi:hypothetical protein
MRHKIMMVLAAAVIILAGGAITYAHAAPAHVGRCGAPYVANGKRSLLYVAAWKAVSPVSQVLADTVYCNGGLFPHFPYALGQYLAAGDLHARLVKGTRLWFSALP